MLILKVDNFILLCVFYSIHNFFWGVPPISEVVSEVLLGFKNECGLKLPVNGQDR